MAVGGSVFLFVAVWCGVWWCGWRKALEEAVGGGMCWSRAFGGNFFYILSLFDTLLKDISMSFVA